jgi:polysaccharide export outer membrane protein
VILTRINKIFIIPKPIQILLLFIVISSCVPQRKLIYLQDTGKKNYKNKYEFIREEIEEETIQPGDELYIRVSSSDDQPNRFSAEGLIGMGDITMVSFTVNENGIVKLPYLGELSLLNFTLQRASDTIETLLTQFLPLPSVIVKFVNKNITILGDVNSPGIYTFYNKHINILQAIGYAGDITTFGNRQRIMLIREENGVVTKSYIDLTKSDIITSDLYIVKPNDIIYIQPLSRKKWGMETYPYTLLFTLITTSLMIWTYFRYPTY